MRREGPLGDVWPSPAVAGTTGVARPHDAPATVTAVSHGQPPADRREGADHPAHRDDDHLSHLAHMHVHLSGCGHEQVRHEDHDDFVHGEHRHAPHGTHYDEH